MRARRAAWAIGLCAGLVLASTQAQALWSADSTPGSSGSATASTMPTGPVPRVEVRPPSELRVTWDAVELSDGTPATGYTLQRVDPAGVAIAATGGCAGVRTTLTCAEAGVPDGLWTYRVTARYRSWSGPTGRPSGTVRTDATPPVNDLSVEQVEGRSALADGTLWFRSGGTGSLRLVNTLTDAGGSGPASSQVDTGGRGAREWDHATDPVTAPTGGPYVSVVSWGARASADLHLDVVGRDLYGNAATTRLPVRRDDDGPTGGALSFPDGTTGSRIVSGSVGEPLDAGSGVDLTVLQVSYAELSGNTCGPFTGWFNALTNPRGAISYEVPGGLCYRGRHVMVDRVGNQSVVTSPSVLKVRDRDYAARVTETPGLVGYWRLGESGGTTLGATRGQAGTYHGGPGLGAAGAIAGESDTSVDFDGRDDHARIARPVAGDFSIEFWFNGRGSGGGDQWWAGAGMVDAELPYNTDDFGVALMADGRIGAGVGNPDVTAMSAPGHADGRWHHVVMTRERSSGRVQLYVDGARVATVTGGTQLLDEPQHIDIGRTLAGSAWFTGRIDEVAIYDRVLPEATVRDHHGAGLP